MLREIAVFVIRAIVCFIVVFAVAALGGCATTESESVYGPYGSAYRAGYGYRYNIPVAPSRVGFHRPPVYWNGNVFRFRIVNETTSLHVRCVIDGNEHQRTVRGAIFRAYVRNEQGLMAATLIPPGETSYFLTDGEASNMRCELYGGPVQVLSDGSYVFKKVRVRWLRHFTPDQFPDQQYRINDLEVMNYDKV